MHVDNDGLGNIDEDLDNGLDIDPKHNYPNFSNKFSTYELITRVDKQEEEGRMGDQGEKPTCFSATGNGIWCCWFANAKFISINNIYFGMLRRGLVPPSGRSTPIQLC
ncbi:hypothetical protein JHK82_021760 [Glycine max]|nr:hypothetical protein JHK82_021760 [Glycine max]